MQRRLMGDLRQWKNRPDRMPLLLFGARQVGKTWLARHFGQECFTETAYLNFESNPKLNAIFEADLDPQRIIQQLQLAARTSITPGKTLLIFDEIQECPKALLALKYFCEEAAEYHVIAAGSLLGVNIHQGGGFPVGKVDIMHLYPMSFTEFLEACGEQIWADELRQGGIGVLQQFEPIHEQLVNLLRQYLVVGGMPAVVKAFLDKSDFLAARDVQERILEGYRADISKHLQGKTLALTLAIFEQLPAFLSRENKRLIFGQVHSGARGRDLADSLQWLSLAGMISQVNAVSVPRLPLSAYQKDSKFKAFFLDVGLLGALSQLAPETILQGERIFTEFKGALTEQYVCQELLSTTGEVPYYWSKTGSSAEVDFLANHRGQIYAFEAKSSINTKSKSLRLFWQENPEIRAIKTSLQPYLSQDWVEQIPLYALSALLRQSGPTPESS